MFHPSSLNKYTFVAQTMAFQVEVPSHCLFQSHTVQYGYETFQNVKQPLQNHIAKNI